MFARRYFEYLISFLEYFHTYHAVIEIKLVLILIELLPYQTSNDLFGTLSLVWSSLPIPIHINNIHIPRSSYNVIHLYYRSLRASIVRIRITVIPMSMTTSAGLAEHIWHFVAALSQSCAENFEEAAAIDDGVADAYEDHWVAGVPTPWDCIFVNFDPPWTCVWWIC